jgi:hypothetical protein
MNAEKSEKIKDYPTGFRISNRITGTWSRVALSMGYYFSVDKNKKGYDEDTKIIKEA